MFKHFFKESKSAHEMVGSWQRMESWHYANLKTVFHINTGLRYSLEKLKKISAIQFVSFIFFAIYTVM